MQILSSAARTDCRPVLGQAMSFEMFQPIALNPDAVVLCTDLGAKCRPALPCCEPHDTSTVLRVLCDVKDMLVPRCRRAKTQFQAYLQQHTSRYCLLQHTRHVAYERYCSLAIFRLLWC